MAKYREWKIDGTDNFPSWALGRVAYERPRLGYQYAFSNRPLNKRLRITSAKGNYFYGEIGEYLVQDENGNLFVVAFEKEKRKSEDSETQSKQSTLHLK